MLKTEKIQNLKDLEYYNAFDYISTTVLRWCKAKPDNEELKQMSKCCAEVFFYATTLQQERRLLEMSISQYREDKNRAVLRARKSEEEVEKLQQELNKLKKLTNLNL